MATLRKDAPQVLTSQERIRKAVDDEIKNLRSKAEEWVKDANRDAQFGCDVSLPECSYAEEQMTAVVEEYQGAGWPAKIARGPNGSWSFRIAT